MTDRQYRCFNCDKRGKAPAPVRVSWLGSVAPQITYCSTVCADL